MKSAAGPEKIPPLRNSKLVHTYAYKGSRRVVVDSEYFRRYGAKREEITRYVIGLGGAEPETLWEKFGSPKSRLRDFMRTWIKPMLDDCVFVYDGGSIVAAPDWPEALERVRTRTDEDTDNRLQSERYARQQREHRDYLERKRRGEDTKPDSTPKLKGKEHTSEVLERNKPEWERQRLEAERERVEPAVAFVRRILASLEHIRLGLLEDMWRERGGQKHHLRLALRVTRCKAKRHAEHPGELFVYPPVVPGEAGPDQDPPPATVTPLLRPDYSGETINSRTIKMDAKTDAKTHGLKNTETESSVSGAKKETVNPSHMQSPKKADPHDPGGDWRDHPLSCGCLRCSAPPPRYVTPFTGVAT